MLVRTRPYRPAAGFDRTFDQLASSIFSTVTRSTVVDAGWRDGDLVLSVDLPGTPAEQVGVSVSGRTLTLSASGADSTWERSIHLGAALDTERVSAHHVDGRLTVTVAAAAKPEIRTVEVSTTAPAAIETSSSDDVVEASQPTDADQPENGTSDNV